MADYNARFDKLEIKIDTGLAEVRAQITMLKWMNGIVISGVAALIIKTVLRLSSERGEWRKQRDEKTGRERSRVRGLARPTAGRWEFIDGQPRLMAPASMKHSIIKATSFALRQAIAGTRMRRWSTARRF